MRNKLACSALLLTLGACKSVSDQAPGEVKDAQTAVDRAQEADIDNSMPVAMELAEWKLERAIEFLEDAADYRADGQIEQANYTQEQAIRLAKEAKQIADMGVAIKTDAERFDNDLTQYVPIFARAERISQLQGRLDELEAANKQLNEQNSKLASKVTTPEVNIDKPLAYFNTGSSTIDPKYREEIMGVAKQMQVDPRLHLKLTGYADPRGTKAFNQELAQKRVATVQRYLVDNGVSADRISTEVYGATKATAKGMGQAKLQLDRKVIGNFTTVAE